ncbi:MAG: alpha/beta hydrolase [Bacteroidia bacterium]
MATIQFSHANGFPAESYSYLFSLLAPHTVQYVAAFGTGDYPVTHNWYPLVDELLADIEARGNLPVVGVGHSLGAILTLWAAQRKPAYFERLILFDPPFFSLPLRSIFFALNKLGLSGRTIPIARQALRRRAHFDDKASAFSYWKPKRLFQRFHEQCFSDYVEHSLVPAPEGGLRLRISPALEHRIFSHTPYRIGPVRLPMPIHYLYPKHGSVLPPADLRSLHRRFPGSELVAVEGGHMFPLEHPEATAARIHQIIATGRSER